MEYLCWTSGAIQWLLWTSLFLSTLSIFSSVCGAQQPSAAIKIEAPDAAQNSASGQPVSDPPSLPVSVGSQPANKLKNASTGNKSNQTPGTSKDRLFFTFPNFLTLEDAGNVPPLTTKEKYEVVTRSSFDYVKFFWYGALAGIGQAENSQGGYGQGAAGYGRRYGAAFADGTIEDYVTSAVFPSLFGQDPRYFQLGKGGVWHRAGYAISRMIITRGDSGHNQFNCSEIIGSGAAASISTFSYYPKNDRNAATVMSLWGMQLGIDTFITVLKEFWPDIRHKLRDRK
jgi:hypothetical protein